MIPFAVRQQLGLAPAERLIVCVEEGRLMEKHPELIEGVKAWFAHIPPEVCLSDELGGRTGWRPGFRRPVGPAGVDRTKGG